MVSIIIHEGDKMSSGHYYWDVLDFSTGIWWRYNDDIITQLTGLSDNVYIDSSYQKISKEGESSDDRFR